MLKKRKGSSIIDFVSVLMALFVTTIMIVILTSWTVNMEKKSRVDLIARKYILKMETEGYLTEEGKQSLLDELRENNMSHISLTGTSFSQVGYGKDIELSIMGFLEIYHYEWIDIFSVHKDNKLIEVNKHLTSTSKY